MSASAQDLIECPRCGRSRPRSTKSPLGGGCPYCLLTFAFSDEPLAAQETEVAPAPSEPVSLPQRLGPYTIEGPLGAGGMGAVYRARHEGLGRSVALKLLKPEFAARPGFTERFQREGRLLASLAHRHIVGVHDLGCEAGIYYLAMEYVEGATLRERLRAGRLTQAEALQLFQQMSLAIESAHQHGIVHRDIKPENVLLDAHGDVKIADFGIAKLLGGVQPAAEPATEVGLVAGTRSYMAPEQLEPGRVVDQRADLYSLAVVFYELLTGELPLGVFAPPSHKAGTDPRLDAPVLQALAKEPSSRPVDAAAFRRLVERAIEPAPPQGAARSGVARLVAGGAVVAVLAVLFALTMGRDRPVEPAATTGNSPPPNDQRQGLVLPHGARVWDVAFDPHQPRIATAGEDGFMRFWPAAGGAMSARFAAYPQGDLGYLRLAFSPTEPLLATAGGENVARLWSLPADPAAAKELHVLKGHSREIVAVAFSPDGAHVATASHDRSVKLWSARDGRLEQTLTGPLDPVLCVAFSPDGQRVAAGVMNGAVKLWDLAGQEHPSYSGHARRVWAVGFSPEGLLVSASHDRTIKVCDLADKKVRHVLSIENTEPWCVALAGEGSRLACGAQDGSIRTWSYVSGERFGDVKVHTAPVVSVRFSADGKRLASASLDGTGKVLEVSALSGSKRPEP